MIKEIENYQGALTNNLKQRKGVINIPFQLLDEYNKEFLCLLFSQFYPLKCEADYFKGHVCYYGVSPNFDILDDGCITPIYEIIIGENEDLSMSLKFVEQHFTHFTLSNNKQH